MRFHCLTDTEKKEIRPDAQVIGTPFYAKNDFETVTKLITCWSYQRVAFPVNPRIQQLPQMPNERKNCATYLLTSGSTATPKIACHSFENYEFSAKGTNQVLELTSEDRWLLSLPLFHVGGIVILFRTALAGASSVLSELPLIDAILFHKITHLSLVPTQLYRLLQEDPEKVKQCAKQLKVLLLGGAPIGRTLLQKALSYGFHVHPTYGLTEMTAQVTMDPYPGPLPFREMKIKEDGEILVKGETLFQGYEGLSLELDEEGFFATKDLGHWNPDHTLTLLGRKDNMFISGGENIQPEEIEAALLGLPDIIEAIVVPKADPEFGMRPVAFMTEVPANISDMLKEKLPSYKIPIKFFPFSQSDNLKRSRKELFELAQHL